VRASTSRLGGRAGVAWDGGERLEIYRLRISESTEEQYPDKDSSALVVILGSCGDCSRKLDLGSFGLFPGHSCMLLSLERATVICGGGKQVSSSSSLSLLSACKDRMIDLSYVR
jgi:hypothetical protein